MKRFKYIMVMCLMLLLSINIVYGQKDTTKNRLSPSSENSLGFNWDVGGSLIRNTITPTFNFNIQYYLDNKNKFQSGTITNFFFEEDTNKKFLMYPNTFIKLELFWKKKSQKDLHKFYDAGWSGFGAAYLISSKGGYFDGVTFKIYQIFGILNGPVVSIELIITNNFKSFFPGITLTWG